MRPGDLPLLGSQLLGQAMAAARPAGSTLDVKHTRWRKFGAFLRAVGGGEEGDAGAAKSGSAAAAGGGDVLPGVRPEALRGLLSVEEDAARGTALVRAVNRDHPLLLAHRPWPATAEAGAAGSAPGRGGSSSDGGVGGAGDSAAPPYRPPTLHEWLQPTAAAAALCSYVALAALRARRRPLGSVAPVRGMWLYEPSLQHSGAVPTVEPDAPLPQEWRALARGAAAGRPPPVLYTRAQAAAVLQEYVTLRGLGAADRHSVVADDRLADALFGPGKGVRSHTGAAAPLSEALFPSLPSRGGHAEAAKDAWDDAGGDDGEEDSGDKSSEPPESGLPSQLDEPFVSHDPRSAVPKDDAARLWLQRLTPHYSISFPAAAAAASGGAAGGGTASCVGADVVLKRGVPPTIRAYQRKLQVPLCRGRRRLGCSECTL